MAELYRRYLHKKSGHIVNVVAIGKLQTAHNILQLPDMEPMVIYIHEGETWVRAQYEFDDGRFELLA